jgi:hypothetical protein
MLDRLTLISYLSAGFLCVLVARRSRLIFSGKYRLHSLIWNGIAAGLVFFGFNEVLDLQTPLTNAIKSFAWEQDLYDWGQTAQIVFVYGLGLLSLCIVAMVLWFLRDEWQHYWFLALGLLILMRFIVVRAASFYAVPLPEFSRYFSGLRINWMLELLAAIIVFLAASWNLVKARNLVSGGVLSRPPLAKE